MINMELKKQVMNMDPKDDEPFDPGEMIPPMDVEWPTKLEEVLEDE